MPRLRLLAVITVLASFGAVVALAAGREPRVSATGGQFLTPCLFSHRAPDDPIVKPGRPGASHMHDFFGNASTDAGSTLSSLLAAGRTTCERGTDLAAYWVPTLYRDGRAVTPRNVQAYYLTGLRPRRSVKTFPAGLRVVAGNSMAPGPQDPRLVAWGCTVGQGTGHSGVAPDVPLCPAGTRLRLRVRFPDCWNGRDLDAPDHRSHLTYSRLGRCPRSHPVVLPILVLNVVYPFAGGAGVTLSSGGQHTGHADFFNAWDRRGLLALVRRCLNTGRHCGRR